jgi:hypothetical protein
VCVCACVCVPVSPLMRLPSSGVSFLFRIIVATPTQAYYTQANVIQKRNKNLDLERAHHTFASPNLTFEIMCVMCN